MKKFTLLILLFSFFAASNLLAEELFVKSPGCLCSDASNTVDFGYKYNFGKFKGICVDDCRFRRPVVEIDDQRLTLSNVSHFGEFPSISFDLENIKDAYVMFESFSAKISHVALIFTFKESVDEMSALLVSPEGMPAQGMDYGLLDGHFGHYGLTYQFYSLESFIDYVKGEEYALKKYRVNLNEQEAQSLFLASIQIAHERSFKRTYSLLTKNCASQTIELISKVMKDSDFLNSSPNSLRRRMSYIPIGIYGTQRILSQSNVIDSAPVILHTP